jgi:transposase
MFHRSFPEIKISATLLQKTYKKDGIKYKYIQRGKNIIDYSNQHYLNLFTEMYQAVKKARLRDKKLVLVDEAIFTFNTLESKAWSSKYQSISVKESDARIKTVALIAAVSEDSGLEGFVIHPKSISTPEFVAFVQQLSDRFGGEEFCMFMDNLQVHKTEEVSPVCQERKVQKIFNVPYSPDFNGIESYFSLLKSEFKRSLLQQLLRGFRPDTQTLIKESLAAVAARSRRPAPALAN